MRDLNMMEIDAVSGAGFFEAISSAIVGGSAGFAGGAIIGGMHGGDGGGIIGIGSIGQLVGMIGGGIIGGVTAGLTSAVIGWNDQSTITSLATQFWSSVASGTYQDNAAGRLI